MTNENEIRSRFVGAMDLEEFQALEESGAFSSDLIRNKLAMTVRHAWSRLAESRETVMRMAERWQPAVRPSVAREKPKVEAPARPEPTAEEMERARRDEADRRARFEAQQKAYDDERQKRKARETAMAKSVFGLSVSIAHAIGSPSVLRNSPHGAACLWLAHLNAQMKHIKRDMLSDTGMTKPGAIRKLVSASDYDEVETVYLAHPAFMWTKVVRGTIAYDAMIRALMGPDACWPLVDGQPPVRIDGSSVKACLSSLGYQFDEAEVMQSIAPRPLKLVSPVGGDIRPVIFGGEAS